MDEELETKKSNQPLKNNKRGKLSKATISKYTLRLSNLQMQAEFSSYLRRETKFYGLVLILTFLALAIISFFAHLYMSEETAKQKVLQISIILGLPSLPSMIVLCLSYKREVLLDLLTPVFLIFASVILVIVNVTEICGEQNKALRNHQLFLCPLIYCSFA